MSKKIIIVGAGIAGLAACTELMKMGFEVEIVEACNYPGGRAYSQKALGVSLGCGASWIHGNTNNPMTLLADTFHANMAAVDPNKFLRLDEHGCPIPFDIIERFNKKFDLFLEKAKKLAYQSQHDISLAETLSHFIQLENFSYVELMLFKGKLKFFENYIGDNYEFLSAKYWDNEETWPGDNCLVTNSYEPIIDGLAKNCQIKFNTVVKKIRLNKDNVEITTENGSYFADAVLVTLPLGVLKKQSVIFDPPLPPEKQKAIDRLGMGLFNITALKFPFAFWPKDAHALFFVQLDEPTISVFFNLHHFIKEPILLGYSGGESARKLETYSDDVVIEKIMSDFQKIFGNDIPAPEGYVNTRWSQNPFSYGSYSYIRTGASSVDYEIMSHSISDRLFFAGEATSSKYPATTHGAYLSGIREAYKIKDTFA